MKNKIYWKVIYRDSIDNEYIENSNQQVRVSHIPLLDIEFECLKKHGFNIVEFNHGFGYAVLVEEIDQIEDINKTYKDKSLVPYVNIRPYMVLCDIEGNEGNIKNGNIKIC